MSAWAKYYRRFRRMGFNHADAAAHAATYERVVNAQNGRTA